LNHPGPYGTFRHKMRPNGTSAPAPTRLARRPRQPNFRLQELRINRGLSPNELGYKAGHISGKTIRDAEAGRVTPLPRTQFAIAAVFGLKPTDIWPVDGQGVLSGQP